MLDLLGAELDELGRDFSRSGRRLARTAVAFAVAAGLLFWAAGVGTVVLIVLLSEVWPLWGASLAVAGLLLVLAGAAAGLGYRWLGSLESPVATVRHRLDDHLEWWRSEVAASVPPGERAPQEAADGGGEEVS